MLLPAIFIHLGTLDLFLLLLDLVFHHLFLYHMLTLLPVLILVLFQYEFALLGFFFLVKHDCVFNFFGLHVSLLFHNLNVVSMMFLPLLLCHFHLHLLMSSLLILHF